MTTTQYSLADVKKHNDKNSTWLVINNHVYDVTSYLLEHPGGEEVLLEHAGQECTEDFEDVGHSSDARELMQKYRIGELIESEHTTYVEKKKNLPTYNVDDFTSQRYGKYWLIPISVGIVAVILYHSYSRLR
ncbi:unnamed protein product [Phaedon cochleariae]|uniref:Cytochrome b5 n=1 Tax=Phaedon cochleariae TaxID=80249 RepID=A0A9P0DS02_PHACE|nr:unnamed protein product [Phaedon cochleariae]